MAQPLVKNHSNPAEVGSIVLRHLVGLISEKSHFFKILKESADCYPSGRRAIQPELAFVLSRAKLMLTLLPVCRFRHPIDLKLSSRGPSNE